jgi:hypothetical protein
MRVEYMPETLEQLQERSGSLRRNLRIDRVFGALVGGLAVGSAVVAGGEIAHTGAIAANLGSLMVCGLFTSGAISIWGEASDFRSDLNTTNAEILHRSGANTPTETIEP